ncbi:hypothetical protein GWI33_014194 [Rhynchophorus ferrugineus]|uniref:CHK kinase-like domain-containing protein n=1 Tax=Rhynchophorus ferrugineus TaxID=354439 RepID=A0A834I5J0_RHYFE|nr:hypothetical protein GWI33_014194 [Rhynchophorus ferrugineus]
MIDIAKHQEDLEKILRGIAENLNLEHYNVSKDVSTDFADGFTSLFCTSQLKDEDNGKTYTIAIKKAPVYNQFDYKILFRNEESFYKKVFPFMESFQQEAGIKEPFNNIAKFYGSDSENNVHIALENLKEAGYIMHNKKEYLDQNHLEYIFKLYGKFHAISFAIKHKNPEKYRELTGSLNDIFQVLNELLLGGCQTSLTGSLKALDAESETYHKVKDLIDNVKERFNTACSYKGEYSCVTHGDCWSNNMLFKYSESNKLEDVKLIDFQLVRGSTPVHDLSYFFYSGASKKDFDNIEHYLQLYHGSFSEVCLLFGEDPKELFPLETLRSDWKQYALLGLLMGIQLWQVKLVAKERMQEVFKEIEDCKEKEQKVWANLMEAVYDTEEFKERARALLVHGIEYGVI